MLASKEFGNGERQAAAHALLRHDAYLDSTHLQTRKPAGLHPSYITFNLYTTLDERSFTHEEFVEAALQDLFDAVSNKYYVLSSIWMLMGWGAIGCSAGPSQWRDLPPYSLPWL